MSDWIEKAIGKEIYEEVKPGQRPRGYKVFLKVADYTNEARLYIVAFTITQNGEMKQRTYGRHTGKDKDGKSSYRQVPYIVSIPKEMALDVAKAIEDIMGRVKPVEKDVSKEIEELGI